MAKKKVYYHTLIIIYFLNVINTYAFQSKSEPTINQQVKLNDDKYISLQKMYQNQEYFKALKGALKEYDFTKTNNNLDKQYLYSLLIADIYNKTNNYKKSLHFYKNSLKELLDKEKDEVYKNNVQISKINLRIGSTFQKLSQKDSAIYYYNKLDKTNSINENILKYKAISYTNISGIYEQDSIYEKAKLYALKAIRIHKNRNNKVNQANSLNNLGNIYLSQKKFNEAKKIYLEGISLIKHNNSRNAVKYKANLYYNLAWAMRNLKDYKAYDFQELSYDIEDSQREKETRRIIAEVTTRHNEFIEQQKIDLVKEQRKLAEAKERETNILFGALTLLTLIISGVVIYNYKLRQKNLQLKLSESSLLQQQSIEKIKSEAHTKILNATLDGKESERKQIAETLHDNVSALLSSANLHLSATKKQFEGNTPQEIQKTQEIILEASQKVRDLSHNLVSSILLKFGLEYALKDIAKKYSNSEISFKISALNIHRYNQEFEIKIFNIIQELTNNILKHSKATNAEIVLKEEKNQLTVLVKDDGVGFLTSASSFNDGIGLNQIDARIQMMNGKLVIDSTENIGTSIHIMVPIQQQKGFKLSSVS